MHVTASSCGRHQLWRQHYQNMACVWLDILGQQISKWTTVAIENDQVRKVLTYKCLKLVMCFIQWTLLAFDATYPYVPSMVAAPPDHSPSNSGPRGNTRNTHIMSSVRISPFPSPAPTMPRGEGSLTPTGGGIGGKRGAFTPYRHIMKRQKASPILVSISRLVVKSL